MESPRLAQVANVRWNGRYRMLPLSRRLFQRDSTSLKIHQIAHIRNQSRPGLKDWQAEFRTSQSVRCMCKDGQHCYIPHTCTAVRPPLTIHIKVPNTSETCCSILTSCPMLRRSCCDRSTEKPWRQSRQLLVLTKIIFWMFAAIMTPSMSLPGLFLPWDYELLLLLSSFHCTMV